MKVATDIGGTITDLVYVDAEGRVGTAKSHTTPHSFDIGVINVIKESKINPEAIEMFIHGSTVVINALIQRDGVKTGLITTKGFRDVLEIARGNRPDLYNVQYKKPTPFVPRYLRQEVTERLNYKGEVLTPLDKDELKEIISYFKKEKVEAIAVAFLHSYVNPTHEKEAAKLIKELWPEVAVTTSYEVTKEWREYERTNTAVLNAYVKPIASSYVKRLEKGLDELKAKSNNYIMQSNGGTTTFEQAQETPINMVESGPVAGIYGAAMLGKMLGEENIIAFDIGGTTAKCSLVENGEVKVDTDYYIERDERNAGHPIKVPVVDVIEIGNGGGSIAWIDDGGSLRVGPQSAGASPGPVAYGQGGDRPTTTDANLLIGRLSPKNFEKSVNMEKVKEVIDEQIAEKFATTPEEAALGIVRVANSNMLNILKLVSVRKGYDPREFTLVAFGGGGPLHAAPLAKELGIKRIIVPIATAVFAAWGMLMTDLRHDYIQTYIQRMKQLDLRALNNEYTKLETNATKQFKEEGISKDKVIFSRFANIRYVGQEHTVKVPVPAGELGESEIKQVIQSFHEAHEQLYTFKLDDVETEIVSLHLTAFGTVKKPKLAPLEVTSTSLDDAFIEKRPVLFENEGWLDTNVYKRQKLASGMKIEGPAIVEEPTSSTVVYPEQILTVDKYGNLIIETGV